MVKRRLETILDRAVGNGDGEVRLTGATGPAGDEAVTLRDELGTEETAEQRQAHAGRKVKSNSSIVFRNGKAGATDAALDAGLGAVGHFLGEEHGEEVAGN